MSDECEKFYPVDPAGIALLELKINPCIFDICVEIRLITTFLKYSCACSDYSANCGVITL